MPRGTISGCSLTAFDHPIVISKAEYRLHKSRITLGSVAH